MEPREYVLNCLSGKKSFPIPGVGFHPTDVELVLYYLLRKAVKKKFPVELIAEVDVYKFAPWKLADESIVKGDLKWYFFCPIEKKYLSGVRMNRATDDGHWKITGNDRPVLHNNALVGSKKTLIFYKGKARGERTDWVMHEYRLDDKHQSEHVLCKIFQKEGQGPRNNAQYGAPFKEEDWIDDEEVNRCAGLSIPASVLPNNHSNSLAAGTSQLNSTASESCFSEIVPSQRVVFPSFQSNNVDSEELPQVLGDDVLFSTSLVSNEDKKNKKPIHDRTAEVDPNNKHLGYLAGPSEDVYTGSLYNCLYIRDLDTPLNIHPEAGEPQHNTINDGTVDVELPVDPIFEHNGLNMRDLDKPLNPEAGESQHFLANSFGAPEVLYAPHQSDPGPDLLCEIENASHNGTAKASFPPDDPDFFEGLENPGITTSRHGDVPPSSLEFDMDELWKQLDCPLETGESQHIRTNDLEQFPVNSCHASQQLPGSDLSQKDSSNKKERKRKRKEHNDERK
ncbi:nac domain-containing protein 82 [Quercus suber]|uniref:Nac domain-containing protein 82 n=1 Tax=Quercus suber TaxID=58331 RepID=A0AAW0LQS7_QUESU